MLLDMQGEEITPNRWCICRSYQQLSIGFITHFTPHSVMIRMEYGYKRQVARHITHLDIILVSDDVAISSIKNDRVQRYEKLKAYLK